MKAIFTYPDTNLSEATVLCGTKPRGLKIKGQEPNRVEFVGSPHPALSRYDVCRWKADCLRKIGIEKVAPVNLWGLNEAQCYNNGSYRLTSKDENKVVSDDPQYGCIEITDERIAEMKRDVDSANNRQVGGDHYMKRAIQPWDYILENNIPHFEACIIRYVTRWRDKGGISDLEKAKHYLDKLIEHEKAKQLQQARKEDTFLGYVNTGTANRPVWTSPEDVSVALKDHEVFCEPETNQPLIDTGKTRRVRSPLHRHVYGKEGIGKTFIVIDDPFKEEEPTPAQIETSKEIERIQSKYWTPGQREPLAMPEPFDDGEDATDLHAAVGEFRRAKAAERGKSIISEMVTKAMVQAIQDRFNRKAEVVVVYEKPRTMLDLLSSSQQKLLRAIVQKAIDEKPDSIYDTICEHFTTNHGVLVTRNEIKNLIFQKLYSPKGENFRRGETELQWAIRVCGPDVMMGKHKLAANT